MPRTPKPGKQEHRLEDDRDNTLARESLKQLLEDQRVPDAIRHSLKNENARLQDMRHRLESQQLEMVVCGRVSAG